MKITPTQEEAVSKAVLSEMEIVAEILVKHHLALAACHSEIQELKERIHNQALTIQKYQANPEAEPSA